MDQPDSRVHRCGRQAPASGPLKILVPHSHPQSLPTQFQPPGCRTWELTLLTGILGHSHAVKSGNHCPGDMQWPLRKNIGFNEEALAVLKYPLGKCLCPGESGWGGSFEVCSVHHFLNCLFITEQLESCQIFLLARAFHIPAHREPHRVLSQRHQTDPIPNHMPSLKAACFCGMPAQRSDGFDFNPRSATCYLWDFGQVNSCLYNSVFLCVKQRLYLLRGWLWGLNGIVAVTHLSELVQYISRPQWAAVNTALSGISSR